MRRSHFEQPVNPLTPLTPPPCVMELNHDLRAIAVRAFHQSLEAGSRLVIEYADLVAVSSPRGVHRDRHDAQGDPCL